MADVTNTDIGRIAFDGFVLDTATRELTGPDGVVSVEPKVFDVLVYLISRRGNVATKDDIINAVWDGRIISDAALASAISAARRATGDDGRAQNKIRTVHGRGFRFVCPVTEVDAPAQTPAAAPDTAPSAPPAPPEPAPEPAPAQGDFSSERAWVSVLAIEFAVGDDLDIEDYAEVMSAAQSAAHTVVQDLDGAVFQTAQTGLIAVFGHAGRSEEHAFRACKAALNLRTALHRPGAQMRMGIETGEALITSASGLQVTGKMVQQASGLARAADSPGALIGPTAAQDVRGYMRLRPLPGSSAMALAGEAAGLSRWMRRSDQVLTPYIGREIELRLLDRALSRVNFGNGQFVGISGEAGIGKSRLAVEFLGTLAPDRAKVFQCGAMEVDQATTLALVRRCMRSILLGREDPDRAAASDISDVIAARHRDAMHYLLDSPDLSDSWRKATGGQRNESIVHALVELLSDLSTDQTAIVLIEDLHWMDDVSADILHKVVQALPSLNVLLVATFRPEFAPPWLRASHCEALPLSALSADESDALMAHLVRNAPARSYGLTGGNPFFIEQAAHSVQNAPETGQIALPPSVQSVLATNIRRLDPLARRLLHAAAVHGRPIAVDLLARIAQADHAEVETACTGLCDQGLLTQTRAYPTRAYAPKHALLQQSAYVSLTRKTRVDLHQRFYQALTADMSDDQAPTQDLARHALGGEIWESATRHLLAAALEALDVAAGAAALRHVSEGLSALQHLPQGAPRDKQELAFRKVEGVSHMVAKGWSAPEVAQAYDAAAKLSDKVGDEAERFVILRGKAQYLMISGRAQEAGEIATQCGCIMESRFSDNTEFRIETSHIRWSNDFFLGDYASVQAHTDLGRAEYDIAQHRHLASKYSGHDPGVCCRIFSAMTHTLCGETAPSQMKRDESRALVAQLDHPLTQALLHWAESFCAMFDKNADATLRHSDSEIACCEQHKLPFLMSQALVTKGWAIAQSGAAGEGIRLMEDGIAGTLSNGAQMGMPYFLSLLAETYLNAGNIDKAAELITRAERMIQETGAMFQSSDVIRIRALIAQHTNQPFDQVSALFNRALDQAQAQSARLCQIAVANSYYAYLADHHHEDMIPALLTRVADALTHAPHHPDAQLLLQSRG